MPAELELRRGVTLVPRGTVRETRADFELLPATPAAAAEAFSRARELARGRGSVTLAGAERSFESHFVPRDDVETSAVVSSKRLRGNVQLLGAGSRLGTERTLRVRALAGTSFGELLRTVHAAGKEYMPFSCPTAEGISLGGALAVNTHSRTSFTYGGMFAEHVLAFRLAGADGRSYDCRADAATELERRLFRYVPGALGALGLVTELELELCAVSPRAEVVVEVLEAQRADPLPAVQSYLERVADERGRDVPAWSEGLSLVFTGPPSRAASIVLGRRRGGNVGRRHATLPLFRDSAASNELVQAFSHRFPALARGVTARVLAPGRCFSAAYYPWAFFQSSWDACAARVRAGRPARFAALGLGSDFGLVHQAWVVAGAALPAFVAQAASLLSAQEFSAIAAKLEFFDVLPLPPPVSPLAGNRELGVDAHVVTLSIAVHERRMRELGEAFCRELSERAYAAGLPLVVQLNKQQHVRPELLRRMHAASLAELSALKLSVDPDAALGSRTLERLGI